MHFGDLGYLDIFKTMDSEDVYIKIIPHSSSHSNPMGAVKFSEDMEIFNFRGEEDVEFLCNLGEALATVGIIPVSEIDGFLRPDSRR